jgi:hypothetical protein
LAIADYDGALQLDPKKPESLFGRGAAKRRMGDIAGGMPISLLQKNWRLRPPTYPCTIYRTVRFVTLADLGQNLSEGTVERAKLGDAPVAKCAAIGHPHVEVECHHVPVE